MKLQIVKGTTSFVCHVFIQNSTSTAGAGLTGLTNATSGLICYYMRPGATGDTSSTLNNITTLGTYTGTSTNSGFKEVDSVNMPGVYEFQPANNMLASGVNQVVVMLSGAANMAPLLLEIQLTSFNLNVSTVTIDQTVAVATSNSDNTIGDCFNAARAAGFGKWTLSGTTYNLYAPDNSTVVKSFTLNSATTPTSRA